MKKTKYKKLLATLACCFFLGTNAAAVTISDSTAFEDIPSTNEMFTAQQTLALLDSASSNINSSITAINGSIDSMDGRIDQLNQILTDLVLTNSSTIIVFTNDVEKINAIETEVIVVADDLNITKDKLESTITNVAIVSNSIETIDNKITEMFQEVIDSTNPSTIVVFTNDVGTLTFLQETTTQHSEDIARILERLAALENRTTAIERKTVSIENTISNIQDTIDGLEPGSGSIPSSIVQRIESLENEISRMQIINLHIGDEDIYVLAPLNDPNNL